MKSKIKSNQTGTMTLCNNIGYTKVKNTKDKPVSAKTINL